MQRHPTTKTIVWFTPDEVREMILEKLKAEGVQHEPMAIQICVEQPFGEGMRVHNEIPTLTVVLSNAGM